MGKRFIILAAAMLAAGIEGFAQTDVQKAAAAAAVAINEAAQTEQVVAKPNYWEKTLLTKLDFTNTSLTNWAAGGYNTATLKSFIDANANYAKDNNFWKTRLQLDYGFLYSDDKPFLQKSDDRIYLESKWGYKSSKIKNLSLSAQYTFKSQFSNSWVYTSPGPDATKDDWMALRGLKSGLLSPANTSIALGVDWIPTKWLTINFAPLTGGFVIVGNKDLRKDYSMQLKKQYRGIQDDILSSYYSPARFEFGAQLKADAKFTINKVFNYTTQLVLFSDYLDKPQNMRVNWDNRFDWKVAKYFSFTITSYLIYDDKVLVKTEEHPEGMRLLQLKESLAFGFSYTFSSKK